MATHAFNPSTWELEAGGSLSSRLVVCIESIRSAKFCFKTTAVFVFYSIYIKCPQQTIFIKNACFEVEKRQGEVYVGVPDNVVLFRGT